MQRYSLPFKQSDKVLEIGGGDKPLFRPNLDMRQLPNVDIVSDLSEPWPVESGIYDGVFGMYIIEHISWRKVEQFISEINRVLKPLGTAVMITANLLEQGKLAIKWFEEGKGQEVSQMIFGDQNYEGGNWDANAHHCGFSPQYAIELFKRAGFKEVIIYEHPDTKTDMIIQAQKSGVEIARSL
jgi:SAM-dependent methyltransferase